MGLANLPWGVNGAVALITVPQSLAARHVPEPQIASVTAAGGARAPEPAAGNPAEIWAAQEAMATAGERLRMDGEE
jgi:hypothetical protein